MHEWAPGYQSWTSHAVSNEAAGDLVNNGKIVSRGEALAYIKYRNTANNMIEIHEWLPGYQGWRTQSVTNQTVFENLFPDIFN
jgi:hypothetical protein